MSFLSEEYMGTAVIIGICVAVLIGSRIAWNRLAFAKNVNIRHVIREIRYPLVVLIGASILFLLTRIPFLDLRDNQIVNAIYPITAIALIAWLVLNVINIGSKLLLRRYDITQKDNLTARMMTTKVNILRRMFSALVILLAVAAALMTFDNIRALGLSLLASAGVAGIVIGFAAQKTIGNFFAGLQIAITQPIRLQDAVIVEGEWGVVEEINLTYVVVKIWDQRRLVLPISYFVEKPFQNWTRHSAELLGVVMLYVDYTLPVEALRAEVDRVLDEDSLWNRRVKVVQVTDARENVMEVRILASADNSGDAFDLRCHLREKLIAFIQKNYPESLPKMRAHIMEFRGAEEMAGNGQKLPGYVS